MGNNKFKKIMSTSDAKSAAKKCSFSVERGWAIGEASDKCCCFIPLHIGLYIVTVFTFLAGINAVCTIFYLGSGSVGGMILLLIALAPAVFAAFLVFGFWCK